MNNLDQFSLFNMDLCYFIVSLVELTAIVTIQLNSWINNWAFLLQLSGVFSTMKPVHLNAIWDNTTLLHCTSAVFFIYRSKMNNACILSLSQSNHTWHNCFAILQCKLQLECDMGWYRYTYYSESHCRECDLGWYRYTSTSHIVW